MTQIGGAEVPFPNDCIILAVRIYPNRLSLTTPYTSPKKKVVGILPKGVNAVNVIVSFSRTEYVLNIQLVK